MSEAFARILIKLHDGWLVMIAFGWGHCKAQETGS